MNRALRKRCPLCNERGIWRTRTQLRANCPHCGFAFEREEGYWVGAIIVNTAVAEAVFGIFLVATLVATWPEIPWPPLLGIALVTNALVPWLFYPRSKTTWLALDLFFNPRRAHEIEGRGSE